MPVLPPSRVTALRHGGLVRCQIQQRLLLVVTREIVLRPAAVGRAGRLPRQRRLQHALLPLQQPLHRLLALKAADNVTPRVFIDAGSFRERRDLRESVASLLLPRDRDPRLGNTHRASSAQAS